MRNIRKHGPFTLYWSNKRSTLDITFTRWDKLPFGWEWGWRDDMRSDEKPQIQFRIGKLMVLYVERKKTYTELWFMGFWWING